MPTLREFASTTGLPWSRDERFYTATVLPQIICRDDFKHIGPFLDLVKKSIHQDIQWPDIETDSDNINIQFFTEFNLKKAMVGVDSDRFDGINPEANTPDLVFLISPEEGTKLLLVIEAKLYDNPTPNQLQMQIAAQKNAFSQIAARLGIESPIHFALLAGQSTQDWSPDQDFNYITWEEILEAYRDDKEIVNGYFYRLLKEAVNAWKDLNTGVFLGKHNQKKRSGADIYEEVSKHPQGELATGFIGRQGGLKKGSALDQDIESGNWRTQSYETNCREKDMNVLKNNPNWFMIAEFKARVDAKEADEKR